MGAFIRGGVKNKGAFDRSIMVCAILVFKKHHSLTNFFHKDFDVQQSSKVKSH